MGNCNSESIHYLSSPRAQFDVRQGGCFTCIPNPEVLPTDVDHAELQTHCNDQIPKGKISINSIAYLRPEEISFLKACSGKNVSAIRYYMKKGVNVNLLDEDRTSPLHVACRSGSLQVCEELLNWGAMLDIADIAGWTPLHIAAYYRRSLICHMLLKKGADPYNVNRQGETPWDLVNDKNTEEIFFVHFDRVELKKMSNKRYDRPAEIVDEDAKISDHRPRENVFRSMVELDLRNSTREDYNPTSEKKSQFSNNKDAQPNSAKKDTTEFTLFSNRKIDTTQFSTNNLQRSVTPDYRETIEKTEENEPVKRKATSTGKKQKPPGIVIPKRHKYYNYFKAMKMNHLKIIKDANDMLFTLRSEDSEWNESEFDFGNTPENGASIKSFKPTTDGAIIEKSYDQDLSGMLSPDFMNQKDSCRDMNSSRLGRSKVPHLNLYRKGSPMPQSSKNVSQNNSFSQIQSLTKLDKNFPSNKSLLLVQQNLSIHNLIQKNPQDLNIVSMSKDESPNHEIKIIADTSPFKVDPRFNDALYKMGVELFNYDSLRGLSFLILFRQIKKHSRDIAFFLYKDEANMTIKKNPVEITQFLTNFRLKECQDILNHYAELFHFENLNFFDSLKGYLMDFMPNNDPEKIDWILRGFASRYFNKSKIAPKVNENTQSSESFETVEAVHMLSFAVVMLNIELHYSEESPLDDPAKLETIRKDFHINLSGINDGDNFPKSFINDIFEKSKKYKIIKLLNDLPNEKTKKVSFRSAKFSVKVHKNSKKVKNLIKDYFLYFSGPICFIVKLLENSNKPKSVFMLNNCVVKSFKHGSIQFTTANPNSVLNTAKFKNSAVFIGTKQQYNFNLSNVEDFQRIENHLASLK